MENVNCFTIRKILSYIISNDYTKPGDGAALELLFRELPRSPQQRIIDIECSLGKIADNIYQKNLGKIVGIDQDAESIAYAKQHFPKVAFFTGDFADFAKIFTDKFDIILMINTFCYLSDPIKALLELKKIAHPETKLAICDYVDYKGFQSVSTHKKHKNIPHPISSDGFKALLFSGGWKLVDIEILDLEYLQWHTSLLQNLESKEDEITEMAGRKLYKFLHHAYSDILHSLKEGILGGANFFGQIL